MKRKLYLFTGLGFIGLNIIKSFNYRKFDLKVIYKKTKLPFKVSINKNKVNLIRQDIFDIIKLKNQDFTNSTIIISTVNSKSKGFKKKFKKLIKFLSSKNSDQIILLSSVSVYGNTNKQKIQLKDQYARNCFFAEKICGQYFKNLKILRIANLFGILRPKPGIIEKIMMQNLKIKKFGFFYEDTLRSFINIEEFINILRKIIGKDLKRGVYNISNENYFFYIEEILKIFRKKYKRNIILNRIPGRSEIKLSKIKNSKIRKLIRHKFSNSFYSDLKKIEFFYKNYFIKKNTYKIY